MTEIEDLIEQLEQRTHDRIEIEDDGDRLVGPGGTELVSARRHQQEITHWIDRRSRYGNPYKTDEDGGDYTREESVENYKVWFEGSLRSDRGPFDADDIEDLREETLGCWCLPRLCHGITIMNYLAETYEPQQTLPDGGVAVEKTPRRDPEELPILSHTEVLGVDIAVPQERHHKEMRGEDVRPGRLEVRIEAWQGEIGKKRVERHLSHWARRNLFDGAGPK